jgi:DNA-directed RNA polymerase subunit H (RpoH/RPB5)
MERTIAAFKEGSNGLDIHMDDPKYKKIYVHYIFKMGNSKKTGELEKMHTLLSSAHQITNNDEIVFVIFHDINEEIIELENKFPNLTIFTHKRLLFNLVDHQYVPKHSRLSAEDKSELLQILMIRDYNKLPLLPKTDVVSRYYNFRAGDVVRVERPSKGNMKHIAYRYVV